MLLIDEEMKGLRPDVPACGQTVFECDACSGGCPIVAKAQLKKVVNDIKEHSSIEKLPYRDGGIMLRIIPEDYFQALLEEVK